MLVLVLVLVLVNLLSACTGLHKDDDTARDAEPGSDAAELARYELATGARTSVSTFEASELPRLPIGWQTTLWNGVVFASRAEVGTALAIDTLSGDRVVFSM